MTLEQSIDLIESVIEDGVNYAEDYTYADIEEAIDVLNLMCAKVMPKHPTALLNDKLEFRWGCPACGEVYNTSLIFKYCPECGQAIDWSEKVK